MTRIMSDFKFQVNPNLHFILKIHVISVNLKDLSSMDLYSDILCLLPFNYVFTLFIMYSYSFSLSLPVPHLGDLEIDLYYTDCSKSQVHFLGSFWCVCSQI